MSNSDTAAGEQLLPAATGEEPEQQWGPSIAKYINKSPFLKRERVVWLQSPWVQELRMKRGSREGKITFSLPYWIPKWDPCNKRLTRENQTSINTCTSCVSGGHPAKDEWLKQVAQNSGFYVIFHKDGRWKYMPSPYIYGEMTGQRKAIFE